MGGKKQAETLKKIQGLSFDEVEEKIRAGLDNRPIKAPSKSLSEIIRSNIFTYFNLVFLIIAAVLIMVRSYRDLTFLPVILANTLIGIIQEWRAKKVLDKLTVLNTPKVTVRRSGKTGVIKINEIVLGDIVKLKAGDQIPVDGEVIDGEVMVNEALLTGEADEIKKEIGDELMSGSFVVSGECLIRAVRVGAESYAAKLTLQAKAIKKTEQSEIIRSLNKLVKIMGIMIIPIGLLLFLQQHWLDGLPLERSIQAMAAAVIGMIPEGLFLLSSVTLAISAMRLALNKVLTHDMKSIETLARVDTLCVDKTGTITDEQMTVEKIVEIESEAGEILANYVRVQKVDNATMAALAKYCNGMMNEVQMMNVEKVLGFSSKDKYGGVTIGGKSFVLGAPELVLREKYKELEKRVESYSGRGYRVLVLAEYGGKLTSGRLKAEAKALALVILRNEIRPAAVETFRYFMEQGVEVKVISGDNPRTVSEVARQVGIRGADKYLDATTLSNKKEIEAAVNSYTVFGRVTPEMKRKLIQALKRAGRTVAMTGDGVNDVLALKDADCSVAMVSGASAAVQAAQIVLVESDFAKMPEVVAEGRRVVNNLERSGSLFLVKNVFSTVMALLAIGFGVTYPLLPSQVSMVTLFTIGVPSFLLAQIPNQQLIKGNFVQNVLRRAVPAGLTNVILVGGLMTLRLMFGLSIEDIPTGATLIMAVVGLIYLMIVCQPFDKIKGLIVGICVLGMIGCILLMGELFRVNLAMNTETYLAIGGLVIFAYPLIKILSKVATVFEEKLEMTK